MNYALNLAEDNRILSACVVFSNIKYNGMTMVDTLPDGNLPDYRYVKGQYIYDPQPEPSVFPTAPRNIVTGEYITVNGTLYKATVNIPSGERIITGQNAIKTTVEVQLAELAKGE